MAVEVIKDDFNPLLERREIECMVKEACGNVKREEVRNLIANHLKIDKSKLYIISMKGTKGKKDLHTLAYYYEDENTARRQLPQHIFVRMLSDEERKKIIEERKKKKKRAVK